MMEFNYSMVDQFFASHGNVFLKIFCLTDGMTQARSTPREFSSRSLCHKFTSCDAHTRCSDAPRYSQNPLFPIAAPTQEKSSNATPGFRRAFLNELFHGVMGRIKVSVLSGSTGRCGAKTNHPSLFMWNKGLSQVYIEAPVIFPNAMCTLVILSEGSAFVFLLTTTITVENT